MKLFVSIFAVLLCGSLLIGDVAGGWTSLSGQPGPGKVESAR